VAVKPADKRKKSRRIKRAVGFSKMDLRRALQVLPPPLLQESLDADANMRAQLCAQRMAHGQAGDAVASGLRRAVDRENELAAFVTSTSWLVVQRVRENPLQATNASSQFVSWHSAQADEA
jgi:hypothetical protein